MNAAGPSSWSNVATVAVLLSARPDQSPGGSPVRSSGLSDLDGQRRRRDQLRGSAIDRRRGERADLATLAANSQSYLDSPAIGQTYAYQVLAVNIVGRSLPSNMVSVPVFLPATSTLTATLMAGTATTPTQIALSWTDNQDWTGFVVQKQTNGGPWVQIATPTATAFLDTPVNPGANYGYRVAAVNVLGASAWSNTATVVVPPLPTAPTNLSATLQAGPQVRLTWRDRANNETGFLVERSIDGGTTFAIIATAPARNGVGNTSYIDLPPVPTGSVTYQVAAVNTAGRSAYSNMATVTVPDMTAPSLDGTAIRGTGNTDIVNLNWVIHSVGQTGFRIQRSTDPAFNVNVNGYTVGPNVTTFTQNTARNRTFYYRIRATFSVVGPSAWSNVITVTTP